MKTIHVLLFAVILGLIGAIALDVGLHVTGIYCLVTGFVLFITAKFIVEE